MSQTAAPATPSRATTVAGIRERMARFQSPQGAAVAAAFVPRADDVFIATYPKCGTTWMQQIVHSLRTGGDMDFDEITEVVPWLELAHDMGIDPNAGQRARPRAFKTHLAGDRVPAGARYIVIIRDPRDVVVSFHRFLEGWVFETGSIDVDTFAREFFIPGSRSGSYWAHLASWWPRRASPDTLMLSYEEMAADLARVIDSVARFMGVADEATQVLTLERASFETMHRHRHQFDDHLIRRARDAACGLPKGGDSSKVRSGRVGDHRAELSGETLLALEREWRVRIEAPLGYPSYEALRAALARTRERAHPGGDPG